ncbi:alpha beta hydrolase fold protein [Moniliophthora roreri MCA 2997]|uniref:Alpha beta hydrolase fold protein n=2 Tax=Moniliophthora roreri TaxID=221103 RepID=V2X0F4_MONRO|nr:alpha beta hydrolase fold protein [Moniliophthora roreri MCA 2997]KAI3606399.1 alpha beta hydrolase fold protein [Moniliophthora roreri]
MVDIISKTDILVYEKQFEDEGLRRELYLIRYDPRGHGQSVMPEAMEGHSSKLYADDFACVCKAFNVVRPVVGGWSLAGAIITDICTHLGSEAISGAIFIAALPYLGPILGKIVHPAILAHVPGIQSKDDVAAHKAVMLKFGESLFIDPKKIPIQTLFAWLGATMLQPPVVSRLVLERPQDPGKLFEAGEKGLKVLFIHGNQDAHRIGGMAVVDELREYFRECDVVSFENAGDAFFYEKPLETNKALLAFTKKVTSS